MREPKNVRHLAAKEEAIARSVFKDTIPYSQVLVSDGLGGGDRPFTVPTNMPLHVPFYVNFNVKGGKYVIHAGDGYHGMSLVKRDKETLIHELTHVWQGENDTSWSWAYAVFSLKDQALSDDAYAYDHKRLEPWSHYGPEQQAQIVEDWYADGMQTFDPVAQTGDRRFYYIKKHIRREQVAGDWTIVPIRPLEAGTLNIKPVYPDWIGAHLLPILEKPLGANDHAGIAARVRKLEEFFQGFSTESARELILRLDARRRDDKLAQSFHYRLATPTRQRLLHILRKKGAGR
jgi:hypothetical protein